MITFDGGYVGLAPVPGGRVNVGIVLASRHWRERLRREGAAAVAAAAMAADPARRRRPGAVGGAADLRWAGGAAPVGSRASAGPGDGWLLVGDAAGFLDPFTGEGLHRALRSAELAADAIDSHLAGDTGALAAYDRSLARRTRTKDVVSLARPGVPRGPAAVRLRRPPARRPADGP